MEIRQILGIPVLLFVLLAQLDSGKNPLADLIGMFGLGLALAIGMLVPRKFVPATFRVLGVYFAIMGIFWLCVTDAKVLPLCLAFFFMAGVLFYGARTKARRQSTPV